MRGFKLTLYAIAVLLLVIVILQNTQTVDTEILFFTLSMPRALLLAVATLLGFVLGLIAAGRLTRKKRPAQKADPAPAD